MVDVQAIAKAPEIYSVSLFYALHVSMHINVFCNCVSRQLMCSVISSIKYCTVFWLTALHDC